jgi:hypothetical protein
VFDFFIEHQHQDKNLDISNQGYRLEYRITNSHKTLSVDYTTSSSLPNTWRQQQTSSSQLDPHQEWIHIADDSNTPIHEPFKTLPAKMNNIQQT